MLSSTFVLVHKVDQHTFMEGMLPTFNFSPSPAISLQRVQKPLMLRVRPPLPLLCDGVCLALFRLQHALRSLLASGERANISAIASGCIPATDICQGLGCSTHSSLIYIGRSNTFEMHSTSSPLPPYRTSRKRVSRKEHDGTIRYPSELHRESLAERIRSSPMV